MLHRNWKQICEMGTQSKLLMTLLAIVDLTSAVGQRLVAAFPECFSETPVGGQIPLSVLRRECTEYAQREFRCSSDDVLESYGILQRHDIPIVSFDTSGDNRCNGNFEPLPDEINKDAEFGSVLTYHGAEWVVVENNDSTGEFHISPRERIDPTL